MLSNFYYILLERCLACQQLEGQDPHTPNIDFIIIETIGKLLGTDIGQTPYNSFSQRVTEYRTTKISNLHIILHRIKQLLHEGADFQA